MSIVIASLPLGFFFLPMMWMTKLSVCPRYIFNVKLYYSWNTNLRRKSIETEASQDTYKPNKKIDLTIIVWIVWY